MTAYEDRFFAEYFPVRRRPPEVPFELRKGDRLLLVGDSITETPRFSQLLTTYLAVCLPNLDIEVRNIGKGGETADGFIPRSGSECLHYAPTVATVCYGMNDSGYVNNNRVAADRYRDASAEIVRKLKAAGTRVVLASPGCIGNSRPWPFVTELNGTLDGLNTSLMYIRDHAAAIAEAEQLPFVDHFWNLYQARFKAAEEYGPDYAVCGAYDGVHPSWSGHVVMAYGFFKALGFDGNLGNFTIDLAAKTASADEGHAFRAELDGTYTFTSSRYPFCAEGLPNKDWSIRSGMTLVPFNRDFNRMTLKVIGLTAPRYRLSWMDAQNRVEEWHTYAASDLTQGINLAEDFHHNPFTIPFRRMDDLILQKQTVESNETWHAWELEGKPAAKGLAERELQRSELLKAIKRAFVPVVHNIRIEELP